MSEQYSIQIPIELKDRLTHEFERLSALVKGKEKVIRSAMASVKDRSTDSMTAIKSGIESLGKAKTDLGNLKDFQKQIESVSGSVINLGEDTKKAGITIGGVFKASFAANLAAQAFAKVTQEVKEFVSASIEASLQMQRIERGLKFATGSASEGAAAFEFIRTKAKELGLDLATSARSFTKFSAAARGTALQGQGAKDIFVAVSEAATTLGLSADETEGALNALQQMVSKGTVQAEELRGQLGERLPGAFQIAARAMGVSTRELGKMLEMGQVTANDLLPKLAKELHKSFGEAAKDAAGQGQAAFNRFNTAIFEAKAQLGDALMPALVKVTEYVSSTVIPFWRELFTTVGETTKSYSEYREELHRLADAKGPGAAFTPEMEAQAKKNLEFRKKWLEEAKKLKAIEDGRNPSGNGPDKEKPYVPKLTEAQKKHITDLLALKEEAAKASAAIALDGQELEEATENAEYEKRKATYGKYADSLELVDKIHKDKLRDIQQKYSEEVRADRIKDLDNARKTADAKALVEAETIIKAKEGYDKASARLGNINPNILTGDTGLQQSKHQQELAQINSSFTEIQEATKAHYDQLLEYARQHGQDTSGIRKMYADKSMEIQVKQENAKKALTVESSLASLSTTTGTLASALKAYKSFGTAYKALAISQAIIDTYVTESGIIKSMSGTGPWGYALGVAEAVAAGVAGFARVSQIKAQKFESGGPVFGRRHSQGGVQAELEGGEFIFSRRDVQNFGGASNLEAARSGQAAATTNRQAVNNVVFNYSPSIPESVSKNDSIMEELRKHRVELGRFFNQELRPKRYVN